MYSSVEEFKIPKTKHYVLVSLSAHSIKKNSDIFEDIYISARHFDIYVS